MPNDSTVFAGLDVHKESIVAAHSVDFGEVTSIGNIGVLERDIDRLCKRMQSKGTPPAYADFSVLHTPIESAAVAGLSRSEHSLRLADKLYEFQAQCDLA